MKLQLAASAILLSTAAFAVDITPLNVKPGQWEVTATTQMAGIANAIPPAQLEKMTPEQRARVEAALKQAGQGRATISRRCIKKEDISQPKSWTDRPNCKETVLKSTASQLEVHMECDQNGGKMSGTLRLEAVNSETVKIDMQGTADVNGKQIAAGNTGTAKWIGAACTEK